MKVFWRKEPLNHFEHELLSLCLVAHSKSTHRDNISTSVLVNASKGSLSYTSALAAALCTLGGIHAPIQQTAMILMDSMENIALAIETDVTIVGWGHDFVKGEIDPDWVPVAQHIENHFPKVHERIEGITLKLHEKGKMIYPNPSAYTAAVGLALGIAVPIMPWLFIHGRLADWTALFYKTMVEVAPKVKQRQPEKEAVN